MNNSKKFLPVGTIVVLKTGKQELMINGYYMYDEQRKEIFDYSACYYPIGLLDYNKLSLFNHEDIEEIKFFGFSNSDYKDYNNSLMTLNKRLITENITSIKKSNIEELDII